MPSLPNYASASAPIKMARVIQLILFQATPGFVTAIHKTPGDTARHTRPEATMCVSFSQPSMPSALSKMQTKMRMAKATWERLRSYHFSPGKKVERISFLWARAYQDGLGNTTVIAAHNAPIFMFYDDCYTHQSAAHCR